MVNPFLSFQKKTFNSKASDVIHQLRNLFPMLVNNIYDSLCTKVAHKSRGRI